DNFCWGEIHAGKPLAEVNNPQLGQKGESGWRTAMAPKRRRVAVVGAGPAGLEGAVVAPQAGHDVTLFSRSAKLGGKLNWEISLPGRNEYYGLIAWLEKQARQSGDGRRERHTRDQTRERHWRNRPRPAAAGQFPWRGSLRARLECAIHHGTSEGNCCSVRHGSQRRNLRRCGCTGTAIPPAISVDAAHTDRKERQLLQRDWRPPTAP